MEKQRGITVTGLIAVLVVVFMAALLGFKLFTPYMQFFAIQKTFKVLATNPEFRSGNRREIVSAFQRYAAVDDLTAIRNEDIEIGKEGGNLVISASYSVKVPLVSNVSLLIDFAPSSASK